MIHIKFLSELHKRLGLTANEFYHEAPGGSMAFSELFGLCGRAQVDEFLNKKMMVSHNGKVYKFPDAMAELRVPDEDKVLVFFVMGGG